MRLYEIFEQENTSDETEKKPVVFTFGRFNPPTKGHEKLVKALKVLSLSTKSDPIVFTSQSHDNKKNPLSYSDKIKFLREFFPDINVVKDSSIRTIFDALEFLERKGYTDALLVVGEDRVDHFSRMIMPYISKYNQDLDLEKSLNFNSFKVVSAGQRDPDSDGVEGISGTKARDLAMEGNEEAFIKYAAPDSGSESLKKKLYDEVRRGLGIKT